MLFIFIAFKSERFGKIIQFMLLTKPCSANTTLPSLRKVSNKLTQALTDR